LPFGATRPRHRQQGSRMVSPSAGVAETGTLGSHQIEDYAPLVGAETAERILRKSDAVRGLHVSHVSSTFYGGGVAEILTPLTLLMNGVGVKTGWRMIQGTAEFFACTKKIHNGLQGGDLDLSDQDRAIYEQVSLENGMRIHLEDHDAVVVHDPQPLPLIRHSDRRQTPWIWQCHIDLSAPHVHIWRYLRSFVECYDVAVFSLPEYSQELSTAQHFIEPAINPFSAKNRELTDDEIAACLTRHGIPTDLPLVVQVSRFDKWKDPIGVLEAFHLARKQVDCTLVLLGNQAIDDPEGAVVLETIHSALDERIIVISVDDPVLVNALQRTAAVVLQKSLREGFGLTVTEAMWKGAAVVGGNVGGIRRQIRHGETGFLVDSIPEAADAIVHLLRDAKLRERLGRNAKAAVRRNYLMCRLAEDWIDLIASRIITGPRP
jgi:trehalose synthase